MGTSALDLLIALDARVADLETATMLKPSSASRSANTFPIPSVQPVTKA